MKVLIPLFIFLQTSFRDVNSDSLLRLLDTREEDKNMVLIYSQLAWNYHDSKPDSALILAQQGLVLARKINFRSGEAACLNEMGSVMWVTGNYSKALELHLEVLKIYEELDQKVGMGNILSAIGIDYHGNGDYKKALYYLFKSKELSEGMGDKNAVLTDLINIGDCYEKLNQLDSARIYVQQANELALSLKDTYGVAIALNNLGNIYSKMDRHAIAIEFYRSALPIFIEAEDDDGICETSLGMAKLFQKSGQSDSALYYSKLSMVTAQNTGFIPRVLDASRFLSDYYISVKNTDSAFVYQSAMIAAKDSLFSQEKSNQLQNLSLEETLRQQEIAAGKKLAADERRANIQYGLIAIGLIVFISMVLLLSRTIIVNEKWIEFLGILGLLIVFEFINLLIHPWLASVTHHSPIWMLLVLVAIAALLVPLHHRIEHWVTHKMVEKNKRLRLAAAKRIVAKLEEGELPSESKE